MLHGSVYDTHVHSKKYEKMIFVLLNFINMFTKYVYLKYELTLTHNIYNNNSVLYEIMWYDHQFLRLRDTFAKNRQAWQKVSSFLHFTDLWLLCGKKSKNKKRSHMGKQFPDVATFFFFVGQ